MNSEILKKPIFYLAIIAAHIIWGGNYVFAKITLQEIPMMSLGFLRYGLASLLIIPFLLNLSSSEKRIKLAHLPQLVLGSLLLACINIAFFYAGLIRTSAITASVLELSIPVISVIGGWWFLKEKIYTANLAGIAISLLGAISVIGIPLLFFGSFSGKEFLGNILILLSAVSFVTGSMILKKMLKIYKPLVITGIIFLIATSAFFLPAFMEYLQNPNWVLKVSLLGIFGLIYITVLSSICAYFLLLWGLSKIPISHANLIQYIEPAVAASLAVPLLGERISFSFIIGTCLIVLGVYWGTLGKQEHHHSDHKHHRN
ncbi:DMT family transporter [Candidatus Daviesbacteria bacterium]|nr:DMT family transporter [Candidatus Daviesbacteria bacterium]